MLKVRIAEFRLRNSEPKVNPDCGCETAGIQNKSKGDRETGIIPAKPAA
jgi:hypothetical protein